MGKFILRCTCYNSEIIFFFFNFISWILFVWFLIIFLFLFSFFEIMIYFLLPHISSLWSAGYSPEHVLATDSGRGFSSEKMWTIYICSCHEEEEDEENSEHAQYLCVPVHGPVCFHVSQDAPLHAHLAGGVSSSGSSTYSVNMSFLADLSDCLPLCCTETPNRHRANVDVNLW